MRINLITALSLLCLFLGCSSKTLTPEEMVIASQALDKKSVDAISKLDIAAFMDARWNDPKLTVLDEDEIIVGSETYGKGIGAWLKKFKSMKAAYTDSSNVSDGTLVFGQQKWSIDGVLNDGTVRNFNGLHTDVKAMRNGKLVIVSETWVRLPLKPEEQLKQVEHLEKRVSQTFESKDLSGFMANYWENPALVVVDEGHLLTGYNDVKAFISRQMQMKKPGSKFEETQTHNIPMGDVVLGYGRWQYTPGAGAKVIEGNYTNVKALKNGKWVLVMDHYSEAARPAKAPNLPRKN